MSVDTHAYLVEWETLVEAKRQEHLGEAVREALENEAAWLVSHDDPDWQESFKAAIAAGDRYEEIRAHLGTETRSNCDKVFGVFFWNLDGPGQDDLGVSEDDRELLSVVLSPQTVAALDAAGSAIPREELRAAFREHARPDPEWYCGDADGFVAYVEQWLRLVASASGTGRGVILSIA
jgi:hypothetical protein